MANIDSVNNSSYTPSLLPSTTNNQKQDPIDELWSGYSEYQTNAQESSAALMEINSNVKELLASYEDAKNEFYSKFDDSMDALSKSAEKLKGYNFKVEKEGAITNTTSTDEKGVTTTTTTYSKDLKAALDTVKGFVDDYNNAVKFFGDYSSVSKRIEQMATTFSDTTYNKNLSSIGLTANSDGSLSINEEKLAQAILDNPDKVSSILGKDGLAGKTEDHVSFANSQKDKLFPTAEKMLGSQLNEAAIYTGSAYRNMSALANVGRLLNMMF